MSQDAGALSTAVVTPRWRVRSLSTERLVLAVATLAVWTHTADEIRIGEYIAVPSGALTLGLLAGWPRLRRVWRGVAALLLGLVWTSGALMYHVLPLISGVVVWQNVSGILQLAGGLPLLLLGLHELRHRNRPRPTSG